MLPWLAPDRSNGRDLLGGMTGPWSELQAGRRKLRGFHSCIGSGLINQAKNCRFILHFIHKILQSIYLAFRKDKETIMAKPSSLTPEQKAAKAQEKADNFKRLAMARVNKSIDALATLRGLANTNTYTYTPEQVNVMFNAIDAEVSKLKSMFAPGAKTEVATGFKF